jgi:hypothetical protein
MQASRIHGIAEGAMQYLKIYCRFDVELPQTVLELVKVEIASLVVVEAEEEPCYAQPQLRRGVE